MKTIKLKPIMGFITSSILNKINDSITLGIPIKTYLNNTYINLTIDYDKNIYSFFMSYGYSTTYKKLHIFLSFLIEVDFWESVSWLFRYNNKINIKNISCINEDKLLKILKLLEDHSGYTQNVIELAFKVCPYFVISIIPITKWSDCYTHYLKRYTSYFLRHDWKKIYLINDAINFRIWSTSARAVWITSCITPKY